MAASFQHKLYASWMALLRPNPPVGGCRGAASPSKNTLPSENRCASTPSITHLLTLWTVGAKSGMPSDSPTRLITLAGSEVSGWSYGYGSTVSHSSDRDPQWSGPTPISTQPKSRCSGTSGLYNPR